MTMDRVYESLMKYALGLLSRRSYTVAKLREKLEGRLKKLPLRERMPEGGKVTFDSEGSGDILASGGGEGALPSGGGEGALSSGDFSSEPPKENTEIAINPIDRVIARLQKLRYLNDLQFCRQWVEERSRTRPRGRYMLDRELQHKGVPKEVLAEFWNDLDSEGGFDESALAFRLIEKRRARLEQRYEGRKLRQNLYAYLASRGVKPSSIHEALDKASIQH